MQIRPVGKLRSLILRCQQVWRRMIRSFTHRQPAQPVRVLQLNLTSFPKEKIWELVGPAIRGKIRQDLAYFRPNVDLRDYHLDSPTHLDKFQGEEGLPQEWFFTVWFHQPGTKNTIWARVYIGRIRSLQPSAIISHTDIFFDQTPRPLRIRH